MNILSGLLKPTLLCIAGLFTSFSSAQLELIDLSKKNNFFKNYGLTTSPKEVVLLLPPRSESYYLLFENPHINKIKITNSDSNLTEITGDHFPFTSRPISFRTFIFPLDESSKIDTLNVIIDKSGENLLFGLKLLPKSEWENYLKIDYSIRGFIVGIYAILLLICLVLLSKRMESKILFFTSYAIFSFMWIFNEAGIWFQLLWPNHPLFQAISRPLFSTLSILSFVFYLQEDDNLKKNIWVKRLSLGITFLGILKLILFAGILFLIISESFKYSIILLNSLFLSILFLALIVFAFRSIRGVSDSSYDFITITIYCVFILHQTLTQFGFSSSSNTSLHQFGPAVFLFIQLLAMAYSLFKRNNKFIQIAIEENLHLKLQQDFILHEKIKETERNERARFARNIHDHIGGILAGIKLRIELLRSSYSELTDAQLKALSNLVEEGLSTQSILVSEAWDSVTNTTPFKSLLNQKIHYLLSGLSIKHVFRFDNRANHISSTTKYHLYFILSELVSNTIKHAKASLIQISIKVKGTQIILEYLDDGIGFAVDRKIHGFGIKSIKARVIQMNGILEIKSLQNGVHIQLLLNNDIP